MQTMFTKFLLMELKIWISKFLIFLVIFFCPTAFSQSINGKTKIIDGDTIHIGKNKIRLYGIDAPEINQRCTIKKKKWKCGIESYLALKSIILNNKIQCEIIDVDQYKRLIGKCFVNKVYINQYMVINGWAIAYRYYSLDFINDEEIAKNNKAGIWKGKFQEPYLFRKQQKNSVK